jgi:hypothetical protein
MDTFLAYFCMLAPPNKILHCYIVYFNHDRRLLQAFKCVKHFFYWITFKLVLMLDQYIKKVGI